jgi:hypothetical protein
VRRHNTDPVALLAGALFITVGAAYLGGALSNTTIEARWVLPTVLITLGFAGLLVSLVNLARQRRTAGVTAQPLDGGAAPPASGADITGTVPETVQAETMEPEAVELAEPPQTGPPETSQMETSPVEPGAEPDDQPRDRS